MGLVYVQCCPGKPERCGRTDEFFFLPITEWFQSLSTTKFCSDWSAVEQDTVRGQECRTFFSFSTGKDYFWRIFFTRIVKWNNTFILWLNKSLCCNLTQTMSFKSQPCSPAGWKLLFLSSPHAFVPCLAPVSHEHPQTPAPAPSFRGACWWRSRCSGSDQSRTSHLESGWNHPALGEEALAFKDEHPQMLGKTFFLLTWCKNTALASGGRSWAVEKPWTLGGIRWLLLNTFTGEGRLKEQNQCAKQTSHCQLPVRCTWA